MLPEATKEKTHKGIWLRQKCSREMKLPLKFTDFLLMILATATALNRLLSSWALAPLLSLVFTMSHSNVSKIFIKHLFVPRTVLGTVKTHSGNVEFGRTCTQHSTWSTAGEKDELGMYQ